MTQDAVKRAVASAVRTAYSRGPDPKKPARQAECLRYAEALIMPAVEAYVEEELEQRFFQQKRRAAAEGAA
jgi:hypothetical protein